MTARLHLSLFGPIQVLLDGKSLPPLRSRKALSLLSLLALREGRPAARGWLAATLWPDVDLSRSLSSLRPLVSELRKALGPEGVRLKSTDRNSIAFDVGGMTIDVLEFDSAVRTGDFRRTIDAYSGPLLEGSTEEWVFQERYSRVEALVSAVIRLGSAADPCEAIPMYRQAISADPLADGLRRGLMEAHIALGNVNAALQEYREYALFLSREVGMIPESQTTDLYQRIRLGIQKPVPSPEGHSETGNLPARIDLLIGRDDELIDVAAMVREHRLVTLTGIGGIGKTELAIAVAANLQRIFSEGVWYFPLESLSQKSDLEAELALILSPTREDSRKKAIEERFREGRRLIVLDNCEHLIDSAASLAERLLRVGGNLHILATSRRPLGSAGETTWPVLPLCFPTPDNLPDGRSTRLRVSAEYDGVRLFVRRAKATRPDFALNDDNLLAVLDIGKQLDGNPLAIELAAARIRSMSPQTLAESLRTHSLGVLSSRTGSRHGSVRATLDWSFELLTPEEKTLFRRLAVFQGGWLPGAAEKVVADDEIESWAITDLLDSLVAHSLVVYDAGLNRFRFLETVRQYADEKLDEEGERAMLARKLLHWSDDFVKTHEMRVAGSGYSLSVMPIRHELPNIRAAVEAGVEAETALSVVGKLRRYFSYDGLIQSGLSMFETALRNDIGQDPTGERAEALLGAGILAQQSGDFDRSRIFLKDSLQIFAALNLTDGEAEALDELTVLEQGLGRVDLAQRYCERGTAICRKSGNKVQLAKALYTYCALLTAGPDPDLLRDVSIETLQLQKELGGTAAAAWPLRCLSIYERWVGNWSAARSLIDEGFHLLEGTEDQNNLAVMHEFAGRFAFETCNLADAETHWEQSARIYDQMGSSHWGFLAKWEMVAVRVEQGRLAEAEAIASGLLSNPVTDPKLLAIVEEDLGVLAMKRRDWTGSRSHLRNGLKACLHVQNLRAIPLLIERLAALSYLEGNSSEAVRLLGAADEARRRIRLVRPPYRCKVVDPIQEGCLMSLGPTLFETALSEGREVGLTSLVQVN